MSDREQTSDLDPQADYQRIYGALTREVFLSDTNFGLTLAMMRAFAIPRVSELLAQGEKITNEAEGRVLTTGKLLADLANHGFSDVRGRRALRQINRAHAPYDIDNRDYLYVLGSFIFVSIRWIDAYAWRPMTDAERTATFVFYRELGRRMGIKNIPATYEEYETFFDAYEDEHFSFTEEGRQLAESVISLLTRSVPGWAAPAVRRAAISLLDAPLREALGLKRAPWLAHGATRLALRVRKAIERRAAKKPRTPPAQPTQMAQPDSHGEATVIPFPDQPATSAGAVCPFTGRRAA